MLGINFLGDQSEFRGALSSTFKGKGTGGTLYNKKQQAKLASNSFFDFVTKTLSLHSLSLNMSISLPLSDPFHIVNMQAYHSYGSTTQHGFPQPPLLIMTMFFEKMFILSHAAAAIALIPFNEPRASARPCDLLLMRTNPVTLPFSASCSMLKLANASSPIES
jgi:hypothetical protein